MNIDLPEETVRFLHNLANEIANQDNRATASPYFYVVRGEEKTSAASGCGEGTIFMGEDWDEIAEDVVEQDYKAWAQQREDYVEGDEDVMRFMWFQEFLDANNISKMDFQYKVREENVFLTEKGFRDHMALNGHNYRHWDRFCKDAYVKYAGRNPEMQGLIDAIAAFKDIEVPAGVN